MLQCVNNPTQDAFTGFPLGINLTQKFGRVQFLVGGVETVILL